MRVKRSHEAYKKSVKYWFFKITYYNLQDPIHANMDDKPFQYGPN